MFVDEVLSIMDAIRAKADDVVMAMSSKWLKCDTDDVNKPRRIEVNEESKQYTGVWMRDIKLYANSHKLVALQDDRGEDRLYCMMINSDILTAADDTYILTYIFKASPCTTFSRWIKSTTRRSAYPFLRMGCISSPSLGTTYRRTWRIYRRRSTLSKTRS